MKYVFVLLFLVACTFNPASSVEAPEDLPLSLPEGASVEVYAEAENARAMTLGDDVLYIGTRSRGVVYATTNETRIILEDLNMPVGVDFHDGYLYVSSVSEIIRYDPATEESIVIYDDLPDDYHHGWRFIAVGPDEKLYIGVGAPCNVCDEEDPYATIARMNLDGSDFEVVARGIRNTVGFDWHPDTQELWFTDNGRDNMGDDIPPDELNKLNFIGEHFGFPYCHGSVQDPKFDSRNCSEFTQPIVELGPHVAALGMLFYEGEMFPEYQGQILIAEHGSWNRKIPIGYRIMAVNPEEKSYEPFATGWLDGESSWGRPVDVLEMPDGSILVSDDSGDKIYRIYRE